MTHFIYSLISFLIALFFVLLGFIGILIPWSQSVRAEVIALIAQHSIAISLFGFTFIAIGVAVAVQILLTSRTTYYHFNTGKHRIDVDEEIVQRYLCNYWKELFNGQEVPSQIRFKTNQIQVTADLPHVEQQKQADLIAQIQKELAELFEDLLGYRQEFHLAISFQNKPKQ